MTRPRRNFQASLESLEGKALLSTIPVFSASTYNQVLKAIDRAAGTFAKTHNPNQFVNTLAQISYKVPYGHDQLLPTWQADVGIYDPGVPGSGVAMVRQLKADLKAYVVDAAASGSIAARWAAPAVTFAAPARFGAGMYSNFATPVLTSRTYQNVLKQIDRAAGTFAKNHNPNQFVNTLAKLSYRIPYGHDQLFPTWEADVAIYDPGVPGSGVAMVQQLKADLRDYVHAAIADGSIRFR